MNKKENTPKDILDVLIDNEKIADVLENEEWQESVADAAFVAAMYTTSLNRDVKDIIREVINYNVIRKFRDLFLSNSKPLPKDIIWHSGYSKLDAEYLFENYLSQVFLMKENGNLNNKIVLNVYTDDKVLRNMVKALCKKYSNVHKSLNISLKENVKNKIVITFK